MTLHEAIEKLLKLQNRPLTTQEIAHMINKNGWYSKKDKSLLLASQIHGRTKNYSALFDRDGRLVLLKGTKFVPKSRSNTEIPVIRAEIVKSNTKSNSKLSFDPIIYPDTKILILGSLPGDLSIKQGEYYAHPRNRFWKILATIANFEVPENYEEKKKILKKLKVGIWDVAYSANRKGSLDSAITNELPNDFVRLFKKYKCISQIAFNGQKAEKMFDKYFDRKSGMRYITLPSSSPANASMSSEKIYIHWRELLF